MTQLSLTLEPRLSFVNTRSRSTDGQTSRDAAKAAVSRKADGERARITRIVKNSPYGMTARQVAAVSGIDYIEVQRRISECGLTKTTERRDGCAVWVAA